MFCSVSTPISLLWWAVSSREWLTPRGGPRQCAVVGVLPVCRPGECWCTAATTMSRPLAVTNAIAPASCGDGGRCVTRERTASFAGRLCLCDGPVQGNGGVSNPPGFQPRPPRGRPGGLLTPPPASGFCPYQRSAFASAKRRAIVPAKSSPFRRARRLESKRVHSSISVSKGGPMSLIKARTRGKQLVRHITRFDRETTHRFA